jgi:hypothetical protein
MSIALLTVFLLGGMVFLCCFFLGLCREFAPQRQRTEGFGKVDEGSFPPTPKEVGRATPNSEIAARRVG